MKKIIITVSSLLVLMLAGQASAEEGKGYIGIASKSVILTIDNGFSTNDFTWNGLAIVGAYDITDLVAVSGSYYPSLTESLDSNSKMSGFEVDAKVGPNSLGFIYFGELGFFSDSYEQNGVVPAASFSGFQFGGGIGYNWRDVNLNWDIIKIRSSSDYEAWLPGSGTVSAASTGLSLSYRF